MLMIEYRIKLPITLDKYSIAHLYTIMEMSKKYTTVGEGVEILENTQCDQSRLPHNKKNRKMVNKVQRTSKRYYIPNTITSVVGLKDCVLRKSSFHRFPHFRTTVTAEAGTKGEFTIDTLCRPVDDDTNVFKLPQTILDRRSLVNIDIVTDIITSDFIKDIDAKKLLNLEDDWQSTIDPKISMVVHKLVSVESHEPNKDVINSLVIENLRKIFTIFHKKLVCSHDQWKDLKIKDIRTMENDTKEFLDKKRIER